MEHDSDPQCLDQDDGPIEVLFFDLDGTLYPIANGYEAHVRSRLWEFMATRLGVPRDKTQATWKEAFQKHNQSLLALRSLGYHFDKEEYWDFIRSGHEKFLFPDPQVAALLKSLPQTEKWAFTNCNEKHAQLALEALGLQGFFRGVVGADTMGDTAKPARAAFAAALAVTGADPAHTAMFEDSLKNLQTAKSLGMTTILVTSETAHEEGAEPEYIARVADAVVGELCESELRAVLPRLWQRAAAGEHGGNVAASRSAAGLALPGIGLA